MTPEKQKQLNENYARFLQEKERMAAEGKPIGTFSAWQFQNKLVSVVIPEKRSDL